MGCCTRRAWCVGAAGIGPIRLMLLCCLYRGMWGRPGGHIGFLRRMRRCRIGCRVWSVVRRLRTRLGFPSFCTRTVKSVRVVARISIRKFDMFFWRRLPSAKMRWWIARCRDWEILLGCHFPGRNGKRCGGKLKSRGGNMSLCAMCRWDMMSSLRWCLCRGMCPSANSSRLR